MSRLGWALFVSEMWHSWWRSNGSVYAKARSVVIFDRIMAADDRRLARLNDIPLSDIVRSGAAR